MASEPKPQISGPRPDDHLCMVCQNAAERLAALVPFIKEGLARGERSRCTLDDRTASETRRTEIPIRRSE